jgi:hypothetical protein
MAMSWKSSATVWGAGAALAAALSLSGCVAAFHGYDTAPNGLPRAEEALRRELATRPGEAYTGILEGEVALPEDDLIRLLFAGTAGRYAGAYHESGKLLDLASYLAEDRVTVSVSEQALSMITSDRALAYTPGDHERLMIHYHAAVAFLQARDLDAAAVEARRIEARLDRMQGEGREIAGRSFFHTLAAEIFDAAGYADAAGVARRRAAAGSVGPAGDSAVEHAADDAVADALDEPGPTTGEVIALVETGHVPHRVEQSVAVMLPSWQVGRLKDGDAGERTAAALDAAATVLLHANTRFGDRGWYYRDYGYRDPLHLDPWDDCRDDTRCDGDDEDPYLLRISWPVLFQPAPDPAGVRLRSGEVEGELLGTLDVAEGARRDFDAERPAMLARTLVRAASKMALSAAAEEAVRKEDETAGRIVGLLTNMGTLLTERADTRCWHLLPGRVTMLHLRLPPGTHELGLEVGGQRITLGPVEVHPGRPTFVTRRMWQ